MPFAIFYFCLFLFLCFQVAYFPLHLSALGFDRWEIAAASTATTLAVISGPPVVLQVAHSMPRLKLLLHAALWVSVALFIPILFLADFNIIVLLWFFCILLNKGAHALVDAQALRDSAQGKISFERVRIWGSIGFVVSSVFLGILLDSFGEQGLIWGALMLVLTPALAARGISFSPRRTDEPKEVKSQRLPRSFLWLLLVNILIWSSHQVFYVYFSLHMKDLGFSGRFMSICWVLAVVSEVVFFTQFQRLEQRYSLIGILQFSIAATVLRWLLLCLSTATSIILAAQLLHALSFGGVYLSSMKLVHGLLPESFKDRGQGYLVAAGAGLGSLLGRLLLTLLAEHVSIQHLFALSCILALLAFPAAHYLKRDQILST